MARPTKHSRDDVVRMVVDSAERLARKKGLRGLSLRKIAAEIGYAPGSLYHLIGDLDQIILHLNARTLSRLARVLKTRIDPSRPPAENAFAVADGYLDFVIAEPRLWGLILEHTLPAGSKMPSWYAQTLAATTGLVDELLGPLIARDDEREFAVATLWAALHGIASLATSGKLGAVHTGDPHVMARQLIARFLGAPAPTQPASRERAKSKRAPSNAA